jgi:hypothetical protein
MRGGKELRSFTLVKSDVKVPGFKAGESFGRFINKGPYQAAPKVAYQLFKHTKKATINFTIREMTQGSAGTTWTYTAVWQELDKPIIVPRGDRTDTITHKVKVKACQAA